MALSALDYPTDIRWERVCVSEDMVDPEGCDAVAPPRWQTSIAVFRFIPGDEYQLYPGRRVIYYKVTCTITGYQPRSEEVAAAVRWDGLGGTRYQNYQRVLSEPLPCHGAVVQATVVPKENVRLDQYPYFLDFQPKQRLLYEQVTDSAERASRSVETLNVRKGGGSTESVEVLDVDEGFTLGAQGSYAGTGGGVSGGHTGKWGTRQMGQAESNTVRTVEGSRESRDSLSHTTQLSQMYTLFQGYHLGTNRALFFVAPRPHAQEEESGFFRSPRRLDGIQEVFLVVSQSADQELPCISVRLDTSHLTVLPEYDFERKPADETPEASAVTLAPTRENTTSIGTTTDGLYDLREIQTPGSYTFTAPAGFLVDTVTDVGPVQTLFSSSSLTLSPDRRTLTVSGIAVGRGEFRNEAGDAENTSQIMNAAWTFGGPLGAVVGGIAAAAGADVIPETRNVVIGSFNRKVIVTLISEQQTVKVAERNVLLLTARGVCCCPAEQLPSIDVSGAKVVAWRDLDHGAPVGGTWTNADAALAVSEATRELSLSVGRVADAPALDGAYAFQRLASLALDEADEGLLARSPGALLSGAGLRRTAKHFGKPAENLTRADVLGDPQRVALAAGLDHGALLRVQLEALGVPTTSVPRTRARAARGETTGTSAEV